MEDVPPRMTGLLHSAIVAVTVIAVLGNPSGFFSPGKNFLKPHRPTPSATSTITTGELPVQSAKDFTEGVCVNAHWYFSGTPYTASYSTLKTALQDLHITCVRDQLNPASSTQLSRFNDLAAAGIKHDVIIDSRRFDDETADRTAADANSSGHVSVAEAIDYLLDNAPDSVISLEGMNENLYDSGGCTTTISEAQQIWATKQADSRLTNIPILSPAAAWPDQNACLGDLSAYTDEGNIHSYPGGYTPDASERGGTWSLAGWKNNVSPVVGTGVPVTATETGYHTAVNSTGGHYPVNETVDGKYSAQLPFAYQLNGVHRSYKYELVDQHTDAGLTLQEDAFGLLRNNLTEKPSYQSLDNIMDLLTDASQAPFTRLDYSVTGKPAGYREYLLQKSDGSHWLAMWNDVSLWDTSTLTATTVADVNVSLTVPVAKTVTTYRPYTSVSPVSTSGGGTLSIPINVHPTLVKIS